MKKPKTLAMMVLLTLPLAGCLHFAGPARLPSSSEDNTAALLKDPEFPLAARAAPNFTKRALQTITRLEEEKANAR